MTDRHIDLSAAGTSPPTAGGGQPHLWPATSRPAGPGCAAGAHLAFGTTDRDGVWLWACYHCPAYRVQRDPTWRLP